MRLSRNSTRQPMKCYHGNIHMRFFLYFNVYGSSCFDIIPMLKPKISELEPYVHSDFVLEQKFGLIFF